MPHLVLRVKPNRQTCHPTITKPTITKPTAAMDQGASNLLSTPELTPLEHEVLEEYERLAENMKKVLLPPSL